MTTTRSALLASFPTAVRAKTERGRDPDASAALPEGATGTVAHVQGREHAPASLVERALQDGLRL